MLKRIILGTVTAIGVFATQALAVPPGFNVQGRLTDANGINKNGTFQITFAVYPAETGGMPVWGKTISGINVKNGNFQVLLKGLDDAGIQIENAVKDLEEAYVEIKVGSEQPMFPRQALLKSPFIAASDKVISRNDVIVQSDSQSSGAGSIFLKTGTSDRLTVLNNGNVGIGTLTPAEKLEVAGNVKAAGFYGDGSNLTGISGDNLGNHTANATLAMGGYNINTSSGITGISRIVWADGTTQVSAPTTGGDVYKNGTQTFTGANTFTTQVVLANGAKYSAQAAPAGVAGAGVLYYDSATNVFMVKENGGVAKPIVDPPGNWTCTIRSGSSACTQVDSAKALSATVSCSGNEKMLGYSYATPLYGNSICSLSYGTSNAAVLNVGFVMSGQGGTQAVFHPSLGSGSFTKLTVYANCCQ